MLDWDWNRRDHLSFRALVVQHTILDEIDEHGAEIVGVLVQHLLILFCAEAILQYLVRFLRVRLSNSLPLDHHMQHG